jgi:hypothetical protein
MSLKRPHNRPVVLVGEVHHLKNPTDDPLSARLVRTAKTHENKFVVLADTAEAICPSITSELIECNRRYKGGVPLTPCYYPLLPWQKYCYEVVLPTGLMVFGEVCQPPYTGQILGFSFTRMKRPSGDQATQVREPK